MFRRYHHGHSAGLGFLLALALERHALVFALLILITGVVIGRAWAVWVDISHAVKAKLLHTPRGATTPQPVYSVPRPGTKHKP